MIVSLILTIGRSGLCRDDCTGKHDDGSGHVFWLCCSGIDWDFHAARVGRGRGVLHPADGAGFDRAQCVGYAEQAQIAQLEKKPSRKKAN